ncbi:MAG: hypothetical protein U0003_05095 [Vampirovibrionales bacterium]
MSWVRFSSLSVNFYWPTVDQQRGMTIRVSVPTNHPEAKSLMEKVVRVLLNQPSSDYYPIQQKEGAHNEGRLGQVDDVFYYVQDSGEYFVTLNKNLGKVVAGAYDREDINAVKSHLESAGLDVTA